MSLDVRTLTASDLPQWLRALNRGFLHAPTVSDEEVEVRRDGMDLDRTQGAYDDGRCVATFRSMPRELTVPGGALLDASAITNVSVNASHRRRGLASRMMANELTASCERGDALAILIAAEHPIYGRFGFGPATTITEWEVDVPRTQLGPFALPDGGRIDFADPAEVLKLGPELHERFRRLTPGAINRTDRWWELSTGAVRIPSADWTEPLFVVYRDTASDRVDGLATYKVEEKWHGMYPDCPLTVSHLIATTPDAERALWRYLLSVDWLTKLRTGNRPPDDLLPDLLGDPRSARVDHSSDFMWLRVLDAPRALAARTYAAPGTLVLDVVDPGGFASGRFRLDVAPDSTASCAPTTASHDLTLPVSSLGALYLGDASAVRLSALGHLTEHRPGSAALADTLFRTPRRPWCPDIF
ncbi:GNAT family N-acetyltransferase [Actinacidiphila soli]|uniref:GNAT family N-acetyltransferase n=1 Tax=Actinacidiphila soli TaxID=2487275 RepID=UPI000FCC8299|nr:GNAT family N-acetyltransferase [Actinacidiphila soli]